MEGGIFDFVVHFLAWHFGIFFLCVKIQYFSFLIEYAKKVFISKYFLFAVWMLYFGIYFVLQPPVMRDILCSYECWTLTVDYPRRYQITVLLFSGCKGVVHGGYCYFLVNQRYSLSTAQLSCERDDAELATISDQDTMDLLHHHLLHTDHMTDKSIIFVWTSMQATVSGKHIFLIFHNSSWYFLLLGYLLWSHCY